MIRKSSLTVWTACLTMQMAVLVWTIPAYGQSTLGEIHGVTRDPSGQPVPQAQVTVHSAEENTDRTIVSDDDGAFVAGRLKPGPYQLKATKAGFASSTATPVLVAAGQTLQSDIALASLNRLNTATNPPPPTVNVGTAQPTDWEKQLLDRIDQLEKRLAVMEAKEAKAPGQTVGQAGASTQPLVASLNTAAGLPAAKSNALSIIPATAAVASASGPPASGTPAAAEPSVPSPAAAATQPAVAGAQAENPAKAAPFSDADWSWLNGNPRTKDIYWDSKFFTPEIRADIDYVNDFNHPTDHSMGGSSELFRSQEVQLEQLGVGGDFHFDNVRARFMTQFGMYSATTPRNDASPGNGQWDLDTAYRYLSEAYGGYHFDVLHGINVDAGIFLSYIGLFSYYNFDNWAYQPSYVSSNTPWFFNGVRVQIFPTEHLKIEPWFINGWQSYASANHRPGVGGQIKWTPFPWINIISNNYGLGHDDLFVPQRSRIHTDNSVEVKYYDQPLKSLDKMAFSFTGDMGCEFGGGVSCDTNTKNGPKQSFLGFMLYNRFWFDKDLFGLTLGGGKINNPGRYLVLLPPINGEGAISAATNSPYFTENPGDPYKAWDSSVTFDWMPKQYITFRWEYDYRHANVPYWSGRGGITPPGGNNGYPTEYACMNGSPSATIGGCSGDGGVWFPDLRKDEAFIDLSILVKF